MPYYATPIYDKIIHCNTMLYHISGEGGLHYDMDLIGF